MNNRLLIGLAAAMLLFGTAGTASANLISNGTFDADLSGWAIAGDISTTWDSASQTAHVGRPGTPGISTFSQSFDAGSASDLLISFEYQWQVNQPVNPDTFSVSVGGTELLSQTSIDGIFNTTYSINQVFSLSGLSSPLTLQFKLIETNTTSGTRIQLDNVSVAAVPIPSAAWILGTGLIGLLGFRRKMRS